MNEKVIELQDVNPIEIYGVNDVKLEIIKKQFPKLKIIARGDKIKVVGEQEEIHQFEIIIEQVLD
jgi:phosphate starvation-inducible protein PhoH and related proteins